MRVSFMVELINHTSNSIFRKNPIQRVFPNPVTIKVVGQSSSEIFVTKNEVVYFNPIVHTMKQDHSFTKKKHAALVVIILIMPSYVTGG